MKRLTTAKNNVDAIEQGLYGAKNFKNSVAMLYHQNSKLSKFDQLKFSWSISGFFNPYITQRAIQPYKAYPNTPRISLSPYKDVPSPKINFFELIEQRQSSRVFEPGHKLSLYEIFTLLHYSYGISRQEKVSEVDGTMSYRYVPSPGGLYPLELYILVFDSHIPAGLYHYRPDTSELECIREGHFMEEMRADIQAEPYINLPNASGIIFTTGVFERVMIKYGERGYRFLLHESGFVAQMMSLLNETLGLGSCMVGGYDDEKLNRFLKINGAFETLQNVMIIGKKKLNTECDVKP